MSDSSSASPEFYPSASVTMAASFTPPPWRNQFYPSGPSRPDPHHNNLPSSLSYRSPTSVCHSITGPAPPVLIQFYNREAEQLKKKKNTAITPPKITERRKSSLALLPPLLTSHFSEYQSHSSQPTSELWGKVPEQKPRETSTILFGGKKLSIIGAFLPYTVTHSVSCEVLHLGTGSTLGSCVRGLISHSTLVYISALSLSKTLLCYSRCTLEPILITWVQLPASSCILFWLEPLVLIQTRHTYWFSFHEKFPRIWWG